MGRKQRQRRIPVKTGRVSHRFELDIRKAVEGDLDKEIRQLTMDRKFASTVRNALRLVISLNAGDTSVLAELYPHLVTNMIGQGIPVPTPPDTSNLERKVDDLTDLVVSLRKAGEYVMQPTASQPQPGGLKAIAAPAFKMPVFDEDDELPTVIVKKARDAGLNFLESLTGVH